MMPNPSKNPATIGLQIAKKYCVGSPGVRLAKDITDAIKDAREEGRREGRTECRDLVESWAKQWDEKMCLATHPSCRIRFETVADAATAPSWIIRVLTAVEEVTRRKKPKKVTSWRTCPECGSRATKLFNITSGLYTCQVCEAKYTWPKEEKK